MKCRIFLYLAIVLLSISCNRYLSIKDAIPTVDYRGLEVKKIEPEVNVSTASVKANLVLNLKFRFNNPYNVPLTVPDHDFKFKMANREISQLSKNKESFVVPPKSSVVQNYSLKLDLDPQGYFKEFMGKDNPYSFESSFYIDVNDYVKNNIAKRSIKQLLGDETIKVPFEFGDTIRLAMPPKFETAPNQFAYIDFLGSSNEVNLTPLSPFIDFLLNANISVYSPTWQNPFQTKQVKAADFLVDQFKILDQNAPQKWDDFKNKWNSVKSNLKIEYPGPNTTGYKIYVPINVYNPNEFSIENSFFTATAQYNQSYNPYVMEFKGQDNSNIIPAKSYKRVYLTWQTNFLQGNIMDLFGSGTFLPTNPSLKGKMGVDLGYGLIEVPYNLTIPLKFGN